MSIPERIGRYQVVGHLATGGMAEILLGKLHGPAGFQRPVVLKRVLPHLARREEFRTMFLDEARIVAGIRHPNVVQVHELGIEGDELFLVMEYLEGESVSGLMRRITHRRERLDFSTAAYIVAEACAGLHAAHEYTDDQGVAQNLVHRDVSPQNMFVTYAGRVKVLDFGIAKAVDRYSNTSTGQMKGKFSYMAPEQCRAEELDRRADLFALGIVLFEMSTGRRLFMRDNQLLVLKAICEEPLPSPSELVPGYPPSLEHVVMMALERDRDRRYSSAAEMRRELLQVVRALDPSGIPEERLGELMCRLFQDRVDEKQEMLRQVRAGTDAVLVPSAEVDSQTGKRPSLPSPINEAPSPGTLASMEAPAPSTRTSKRGLLLGGAAASVVTVLTAIFIAASGSSDADTAERAHAAASGVDTTGAEEQEAASQTAADREDEEQATEDGGGATQAQASSAEDEEGSGDAAETEPPEAPPTVHVGVTTMPPGASVRIDGEPRGTTPVDLELVTSSDPIEVMLVLSGYETHVERIVPDVAQRLRLTLRRRIVRRRGTGSASNASDREPAPMMQTEMETAMTGGFFRFD